MNIHHLQSLIAAIITLTLALFVYLKNKTNPLNRTFTLLLLCLSFWNIDVFGIRSAPNADYAELWGKIFRPGLLFVPAISLHFVIYFIGLKPSQKGIKWLLIIAYTCSGFFTAVNWTPYFTGDAAKYSWGYSVQTGPLYLYFMGMFFIFMGISFGLLIRNYFKVDRYQQQRIKYFLLALIVSYFLGSLGFLPMLGFEVYPFGNIALTIGFFIVAYSVAQHRLMDVSLFMAKGLGYFLSIVILAIPSFFIILF